MITIDEKQKEDDTPVMVDVEFHDDNDGSIVKVLVPEGTRLTEAAEQCGVKIPTLCHHPRLAPAGKCGVCVVAVEGGPTPTQLACSTVIRPTKDGSSLRVHVHGAMLNGLANAALRRNLDLSIRKQTQRFVANNGNAFAPCGSLEIEDLAEWMNQANLDATNCITYDPSLCIGCSRCVRACDLLQGMKVLEAPLPTTSSPAIGIALSPPCMATRAGRPLRETDCISCGQCTVFCPTGAIKEVSSQCARYLGRDVWWGTWRVL
jgi:NADP-reducing hydrogenase subunit HndD